MPESRMMINFPKNAIILLKFVCGQKIAGKEKKTNPDTWHDDLCAELECDALLFGLPIWCITSSDDGFIIISPQDVVSSTNQPPRGGLCWICSLQSLAQQQCMIFNAFLVIFISIDQMMMGRTLRDGISDNMKVGLKYYSLVEWRPTKSE